MGTHNPWKPGDGDAANADRPTDAPAETLAEGLARANGAPVRPFDDDELAMILRIATWITRAAVARGFPPPEDALRAVILAAGQSYTFNVALDAQEAAQRSAELDDETIALPPPTAH